MELPDRLKELLDGPTFATLATVIPALHERGYQIVTLSELEAISIPSE